MMRHGTCGTLGMTRLANESKYVQIKWDQVGGQIYTTQNISTLLRCWKICLPVIYGHSDSLQKYRQYITFIVEQQALCKCPDVPSTAQARPLPWLPTENFYDPT